MVTWEVVNELQSLSPMFNQNQRVKIVPGLIHTHTKKKHGGNECEHIKSLKGCHEPF